MVNYPSVHSDEFVMPKPWVQSKKCDRDYINLRTVNKERLFEIIDTLDQRNPAYIETLSSDGFIEQLQKNFNAEILLPMRLKHMIVVFGEINANDRTLIAKLKKFFEADNIIPNWNGKDQVDETPRTLLLTQNKPPYLQPYNAISLEGAKTLL